MRRPVFAANWKMNHGPQETRGFLQRFTPAYPETSDRTVVFFPPALSLAVAAYTLRDRADLLVGVQNIHWEERGAFTGENSAAMARAAGAQLALVGHSERRHLFGETDDTTARKCAAACRAGLIPVLCVGERLEERERHATHNVVMRQLRAGLGRLEPSEIATMLVAYEPVWAIGTGRTAHPDDATSVHATIRRVLREAIGSAADDVPILYGGSVTPDNAGALLAAPEVDGLLVGGASLEPESWLRIVRT